MRTLGVDNVAGRDVGVVRELRSQLLDTRAAVGRPPAGPGRPGPTMAIPFPRAEVTPLIVYIAGFFDAQQRLRAVRDRLRTITSWRIRARWLDEVASQAPLVTPPSLSDDYRRYAERDLEDIIDCHLVLVDTLDVTPRGGREVEVGYALGLYIPFIVVGPKRNVFHELAKAAYEDWDSVYRVLADGGGLYAEDS